MPRKLTLLVAVHLLLGMAPIAMFLHPGDLRWIPLTWALASISFGQLMLLAFWAGLGTSAAWKRLAGSAAGACYLATWPTLALVVSPNAERSGYELVAYVALFAAMLVMFGGIFLLWRRRFAQLRCVDDVDERPAVAPRRRQFSVLHLLLLMSIVAVVLGLMRGATAGDTERWHELAINLLGVVALVVNIIAAPWAALALGPARGRVALVLVVSVLLGMAVSFTAVFKLPMPEWRVWLFSTQSLAFAVPPLILVASLLVVRSCGYRLVPLPKRVVGVTTGA
jgi:hypothetical protein